MTKTTRRGLFYGLIVLFIVVSSAVILYSEGWRLDLGTGQVTKIGAIYIRSYPKDAAISLNGKSVENKSGFFSPGTLISDLFPKTYTVRLTENGYSVWQEKATVLPSFVTPLKYAVLIPQNSTEAASGTTAGFFTTPGTIVRENAGEVITVNGSPIGQGTLLKTTTDGHTFLFDDANGNYRIYTDANGTTTNLSALLAKDGIAASAIQEIILDPHNNSEILVVGQKNIWMLDLRQQALTLIEKTPAAETLSTSIAVSDGTIAWTRYKQASGMSEVALYDRGAGTLRDTSTTIPGSTEKIGWIRGSTFGILQTDGSLYLYDSDTDTAKKLADDARDFFASSDGTMIAALENSSMEIFDLNDLTGYYRFNLPNLTQIQQLIWYKDDSHLFVVYPDYISFLDFQDTSLSNFTTVTEGTSPSYDQNSNSLYFIDPKAQLTRLGFSD